MDTTRHHRPTVVVRVVEVLPSPRWCVPGSGAMVLSAVLQIAGTTNGADAVGTWPPTVFAIGIAHTLVRPGQEDAAGALEHAVDRARDAVGSAVASCPVGRCVLPRGI